MTDRTEAVLNRIDATLNACICGQPIPDTGPSPDYCNETCQYEYTAAIVGAEPDPELTYPLPPAETNGHAINTEANTWITDTAADYEEEPLADVIARAINAAANESMDRVAHILATQPHTAEAVHKALARGRLLDTLVATVPDQVDAYLDACDNDPRIALEYAQAGIPPAMIPSLRENGITAVQAAISINTTDRSAL